MENIPSSKIIANLNLVIIETCHAPIGLCNSFLRENQYLVSEKVYFSLRTGQMPWGDVVVLLHAYFFFIPEVLPPMAMFRLQSEICCAAWRLARQSGQS